MIATVHLEGAIPHFLGDRLHVLGKVTYIAGYPEYREKRPELGKFWITEPATWWLSLSFVRTGVCTYYVNWDDAATTNEFFKALHKRLRNGEDTGFAGLRC